MAITTEDIIRTGREVLTKEKEAIEQIASKLGDDFVDAVFLLINRKGKIVLSGVGKSGHIAKKLSATLTSVGLHSVYIHPSEGAHGDLGILEEGDIFVAISNSGETEELLRILPTVIASRSLILAITSNPESTLAKHANLTLTLPSVQEAGPLGLAPTTSTTATLALGDALACCCMQAIGLTKEKFAFSHPAGRLGRRLALRVSNVMKPLSELPLVFKGDSALKGLKVLVGSHLGCFVVVDTEGKPFGIFTEGDLGRFLEANRNLHDYKVEDICTIEPKAIQQEMLAFDALKFMKFAKVNQLVVTSKTGELTGILHIQQLLEAKV